jgi:hypothetical protein
LDQQRWSTCGRLALENICWTFPALLGEWRKHERAEAFDPMRGLMLLGLAMVNEVGEFASTHRAFVAEHLR